MAHGWTTERTSRLPVAERAGEIAKALSENHVVVVSGETGSGKTTQIPQICLALGRAAGGKRIACTQPRRIAAVSVAERVAAELGPDGRLVGWQHRFASKLSGETRIKFMTDGILLAEIRSDPLLRAYDTIMVDEAHERTLNVDFLLGCLRKILPKRPDLKVIISSATMETKAFSTFFGGAPVLTIPGRTFDVEVRWRPPEGDEPDLAAEVAKAVKECRCGPYDGDILVFLPGERDIRAAAEAVKNLYDPKIVVLPLYSSLPAGEQRKAFETIPGRVRTVLATNVAETSVTIPGIRYVIDSGLARISRYSPRALVKRLHVEKISKASAEQRKGRCGRLGPGLCIRLYDEESYSARPGQTDPEIRRTSLAGTILLMMDWRLGDIETFPFLQPPPSSAIREGRKNLLTLGAIEQDSASGSWHLTALGRRMAKLPLEPSLSRMLFEAEKQGAVRDALTVVSALGCENPLVRPQNKPEADAAAQAHSKFRDTASDFDGILKLWNAFHDAAHQMSRTAMRKACLAAFVSWRRLGEWEDIRAETERQLRRAGVDVESASGGHDGLHKALLSGLLQNIAVWDDEAKNYKGAAGSRLYIFPASGLAKAKQKPKWIVCAERFETTKLWARTAAAINPEWIIPLAETVSAKSYTGEYWDGRSGTSRALRRTTLYGLVIEDGVRCDISRAKPATSRTLLIRHGLVLGELPKPLPRVVARNLETAAARIDAATKDRSLSPEAEIEAFCALWDERLPQECVNWKSFRRWLSLIPREQAESLVFSPPPALASAPDAASFPETLDISLSSGRATAHLAVAYKHDREAPDDGITCTVAPEDIASALLFDSTRLVPGALPGLVAWMLRALPRATLSLLAAQAGFDPHRTGTDEIARSVAAKLPDEGSMPEVLVETLARDFGIAIPRDTWTEASIPAAWKWRWAVCAGRGGTVFDTRSADELAAFAAEYEKISAIRLPTAFERIVGTSHEASNTQLLKQIRIGTLGNKTLFAWTTAEPSAGNSASAVRPALRTTKAEAEKTLAGTAAAIGAKLANQDLRAKSCRTQFAADAETRAAIEIFSAHPPCEIRGFESCLRKKAAAFRSLAADIEVLAGAIDETATQCLTLMENPALKPETVSDAAEQLGWLCPPGFTAATPSTRLAEFPRYLEALDRRLRLAAARPEADMQKVRLVRPVWKRYTALVANRNSVPPFDEEAAERYRWLVEELRVAIFAQALGTPEPASVQRLDKLWAELTATPHQR